VSFVLPQFDRSDDIIVDDEVLRFEREWEDGTLSLTRVRAQRPFMLENGCAPTVKWFLTSLADGSLKLKSTKLSPSKRPDAVHLDPDDTRLPRAQLIVFVNLALDRMGCPTSNNAIELALEEIFTPEVVAKYGPQPPAPTVRKWRAIGTPFNRSVAKSASQQGRGPRRKRKNETMQQLLRDAALFYWSAREIEITVADALAEHEAAVGRYNKTLDDENKVVPYAEATIRRKINATKTWDTYAAKYGPPAADAHFKANGKSTRAFSRGEIGIVDHNDFDALVAIDDLGHDLLPVGSPTITAIMDDRTECVFVVVHVTPPSLYNMIDVIKHANAPKMHQTRVGVGAGKHELLASIYTKFDTILPDNAWEFTGSSGQDSMHECGSHIDWSRAGMPQDKAKLERFWRTLRNYLAKKLPAARIDPKLMKLLGYDPSKQKAVLLSKLKELVAEAVAYYHIEVNTGMDAQPARLWEKETKRLGPPSVIRDASQLDLIMGKTVTATLTTNGVEIFRGLVHNTPANTTALLGRLAALAPKGRRKSVAATARVRVKVKYNPVNILDVHVYDPVLADYVTLRCTDEDYSGGLSERHHETLVAWTNAENIAFNTPAERRMARATLNEVIREAAPEMAVRHRKRAARLIETGTIKDDAGNPHVPSEFSFVGQAVPHRTAVADRKDGGVAPKMPVTGKTRRKAPAPQIEIPAPDTGLLARGKGRPTKLSPARADDWGGLSLPQ